MMMVFEILAKDSASGTFTKAGASAEAASKKIDLLGKAAFGASAAFAAFAVKDAVQFESAMTRINTQAGVPVKNIKALSDAVLQLSPKVGFNPTELATSLYHVESAFHSTGISAKAAIDVVQQASKLSKIGNADLETTTQAVVGTLASKIKGVKDAADAAAQLNQLVGAGDTTLQKVAQGIGSGILPTAAALGLSFKDVAAATATLTDNVTPADEVMTRLRTTFSTIEKPTKAAQVALSTIGISSTKLADDFRQPNGLLLAMQDLKTHLNDVYPLSRSQKLSTDEIAASTKAYTGQLLLQGVASKDATDLGKKYADSLKKGGSAATLQAQTILQAFGGAKSGSTFLTLYTELDRLQSKYKEFGTSAQAATKFQDAWAQTQQTTKFKLDALKASWDVFLIQAGTKILPIVKDVADELSRHPGILKDVAIGVAAFGTAWALVKIDGLARSLAALATRILAIGTASTTAAAETRAAALGSAVASSTAAAGAGGVAASEARYALPAATRLGAIGEQAAGSALARIAIPVGLTIVAIDAAKADKSILADLQKGHFGDAIGKGMGTLIAKGLTGGLSKTIGDVLTGQFSKALSDFPGASLYGKLFGTGVGSGKVVGTLADELPVIKQIADVKKKMQDLFDTGKGGSPAYAKLVSDLGNLNVKLADIGNKPLLAASTKAVDAFHTALGALGSQIDGTTHALDGNTERAQANRSAILGVIDKAKDAATAYSKATGKTSDYRAVLAAAIPQIEAQAAALGLNVTQVDALIKKIFDLPATAAVNVSTPGASEANTALAQALSYLQQMNLLKNVAISISANQFGGNLAAASQYVAKLAQHGKNITPSADGNLFEKHTAQISHGMRLWAEPETGGEAYIPLAASKRQRSLAIWAETGRRLGVAGFAAGAVVGGTPALNPAEISYLTTLNNVSKYLKAMAASTAALTSKLTTFVQSEQAYRDSLKTTVSNGAGISDLLAQSGNAGDLKTLFAGKIGDIKAFVAKIGALKKQGWPNAIIREIANDGIGTGVQYADLLLNASKADRSVLIGDANTLSSLQAAAAVNITALTGNSGLTQASAINALKKATFTPGANTTALIAQAAAAQTRANYAPVQHIEHQHIASNVDFELKLKQAQFLQNAGGHFS